MRRVPSNRMPPYEPEECSITCILACGCFIALMATIVWLQPLVLLAILAVAMFCFIELKLDQSRIQRNLADRQGESLCSFVRSFDYRNIDTWILRAVYEQIQPHVGFPIRKTDNLTKDLKLAADDVDDLADEIAQRTGRPLIACETNPYYSQVNTIEGLVMFFSHQPQESREHPG
ncbi:MAG: hypothetical protein RH917_11650 [Lacipirellulaceae bacterium]